jgi:leader peptidase (prepilin peptidase) / N-methyltransferase
MLERESLRDVGDGSVVSERSKIVRHFVSLAAAYAVVALPVLIAVQPGFLHILITTSLGLALAALSAIDIDCLRLPDALTLPLVATGLGLAAILRWDDPWLRLLAALAGYSVLWGVAAVYERMRHRAGLGLGDAKLFAAAGAWVGFEGLASVLLYGSLAALVWAGFCAIRGQAVSGLTRLPFGPFLASGLWWVWLYGPATFAI